MTSNQPGKRTRAYAKFVFAILYFFVARVLAHRAALGFSLEQWSQRSALIEQSVLAFLLIAGFGALGYSLDRQTNPMSAQGWPRRAGWPKEAGLGLATGWGLTVVCVLPLVLIGGIAIRVAGGSSAWGWLAADTAFFAVAALAEEVAFRGYAFQRFADALGGLGAALAFASFYAILQTFQPFASYSTASVAASVAFSLLLSTAYLRTRALWMSWGLNFAWKASRALLFGLALAGDTSHSPVIQGDPMGPFWVTGGGYGIDAAWFTFLVLLAAIPLVFRLTRDLDYRYNAPVIVAAGIPVDLDAAARRQHETAMGSAEPAAPALVQILPVAAPAMAIPDAVPHPTSADAE